MTEEEILGQRREAECSWHDWEELIDPQSGGWMRCRKCGKSVDCEDPDGEGGL